MKDANFVKQNNRNATAFPLANFSAELLKQPFNITPLNIGTYRMGENCFKGSLVFSLHLLIVPYLSTIKLQLYARFEGLRLT